jgi:hypothetical protein
MANMAVEEKKQIQEAIEKRAMDEQKAKEKQ